MIQHERKAMTSVHIAHHVPSPATQETRMVRFALILPSLLRLRLRARCQLLVSIYGKTNEHHQCRISALILDQGFYCFEKRTFTSKICRDLSFHKRGGGSLMMASAWAPNLERPVSRAIHSISNCHRLCCHKQRNDCSDR